MKKILIIGSLLVLISISSSHAQLAYGTISYNLSFPMSSTGKYVDNSASTRGGSLELGGFLTDRFSLGIGASWNVFYKNAGLVTFTENNTTITGKQYRYYNAIPVYVMARYFMGSVREKPLLPFIGLGTGALYGRQRMDIGLFAAASDGWQYGLFPEAGLQYRLRSGLGFVLTGRYNHGFENNKLPTTSFVGINLGVTLPLR